MLSLQTKTTRRRYGVPPQLDLKSPISPLRLESLIYVESPRSPRTSSLRPSMEPIKEQIETEEVTEQSRKSSSPLLALPKELRLQIWEYAIGGQDLGVATYTKLLPKRSSRSFPLEEVTRLGLTGSTGDFIPCTFCRRGAGICTMPREWHLQEDDFERKWDGKSVRLALLLTCKSIYAEAQPVLYSTNHLYFQTFTTLGVFLAEIAPASIHAIRHLTVGYGAAYFSHLYRSTSSFGKTFTTVTEMQNLQSFTIVLTTDWISKTSGEKVTPALMLGEFKGWSPRRQAVEKGKKRGQEGFVVKTPMWEADDRKRAMIQQGLRESGLLCQVGKL